MPARQSVKGHEQIGTIIVDKGARLGRAYGILCAYSTDRIRAETAYLSLHH